MSGGDFGTGLPFPDARRLRSDLEAFSRIGWRPDGAHRLALSAEDLEARRLLVQRMREAGLSVRIDGFGNLWGRTGGRWEEAAVVAGSHLDTVPGGGGYDGVVGVVAALEAVRCLQEHGLALSVPLGVVDFTAEESARFGVATLGSKGAAGLLPPGTVAKLQDRDGIRFAEALAAHGGLGLVDGPREPGAVGCFLELHVEQGRELEEAGVPLGVVTAVAAPTRFRITLRGEAAHSGTTLMAWRRDALAAASELILAVERIAREQQDQGIVAAATIFALRPVSINVVPGYVQVGVDIRGQDVHSKRRAAQALKEEALRAASSRGVEIEIELLSDEEPVQLDPRAAGWLRKGCEAVGVRPRLLASRAGHDAMNMARRWPAGLLFVPSRNGLSHNPAEFTPFEAIELGTRALMAAMVLAARDLGGGGRGSSQGSLQSRRRQE